MRVLLVFVDGLGIGRDDPAVNPLITAHMPVLRGLLGGTAMPPVDAPVSGERVAAVPLDATMGVPGLPQSATGQTALLTGQNAAAAAGGHVNGKPTPVLKGLLATHSIYARLKEYGRKVTFINAYRDSAFEMMRDGTYVPSASTIAALGAGLRLRTTRDAAEGRAVYHDITSDMLRAQGYDVPQTHPCDAGQNAARIAFDHDLSVFEYFLTDKAGHRQDMDVARKVLSRLDAFLGGVLDEIQARGNGGLCVVLSSDHGNVEDLSTPGHTRNPVPAIGMGDLRGRMRDRLLSMKTIMDVAGAIVDTVMEGERE